MQSSNGKRPVVELVMLTNGKYQPIKFTNNRYLSGVLHESFVTNCCSFRQVTEAIPKRLFDQANMLRKTLYQRSVQVPKIGTKQVFLAINPTPGGVKPYSSVSSGPPVSNTSKGQQVTYPRERHVLNNNISTSMATCSIITYPCERHVLNNNIST